MMQKLKNSRFFVTGICLFAYALPMIFLSVFAKTKGASFAVFTFGLFLASIASAALFLFLDLFVKASDRRLEQEKTNKEEALPLEIPKENSADSLNALKEKEAEIARLNELLQHQSEQSIRAFEEYKAFTEDLLEKKEKVVEQHKQIIGEQRKEIEEYLKTISDLEMKEKDLKYEIKTLVGLGEAVRK